MTPVGTGNTLAVDALRTRTAQRQKKMKLLVFGSTGGVGRYLVEQALGQGHDVTAFVRTPVKLNIDHANLTIFQGDVMDPASVERAVQDQEAVVAALGSPLYKNTNVRSDGTCHIVRAMEKGSVRRFVSLSTLGVGDSWKILNVKYKILFRTLLRWVFTAHERQEEYIRQSQLEWVIVRPGEFTDGGCTGAYRHGFSKGETGLKLKISRADVADFMLEQVESDTYLRQAPGVSY